MVLEWLSNILYYIFHLANILIINQKQQQNNEFSTSVLEQAFSNFTTIGK